MDDLHAAKNDSPTVAPSRARRLPLLLIALGWLGAATAAEAGIDVSTVATLSGKVVQGTITLANTSSQPVTVTSLRNTLEVRFDDDYVPQGFPVGSEPDYFVVATTYPAFPAQVAGFGTVAIPFSIDTCSPTVTRYPGGVADDIRSVAAVTSSSGSEEEHSDNLPAPNQATCPFCGNGIREGTEQCDGGSCCTAACTFAADGASCSDANACTQTDQCQTGACVGSNPVACTASDQCHAVGTCAPGTGICSNPAKPNGSTCNDGNACSVSDACSAGVCRGAAMNCDDGNVCTDDSCAAGACAHASNTSACEDGDVCTTDDSCAAGACQSGGARDCNDHQSCTSDACEAGTGCTYSATATCDSCNHDECTTCRGDCAADEEQCGQDCWTGFMACLNGCGNQTYCAPFCQVDYGHCLDTCPPERSACNAACDAGNGCSAGCSSPADTDGDGIDDAVDNCDSTPNVGQADLDGDGIGDACDSQTCGNGTREGTEGCDGGACCTAACATKTNGSSCSDANACTVTDRCEAGTCVPGSPVVCAADQCHLAGSCNPATGTCSLPARADGTSCNDGNACSTGDACVGGQCVGAPMACDDSNGCTDDACVGGSCVHTDRTSSCDDGDACTSGEVCAGGECGGGASVDCDDRNACTTDACVPANGCVSTPIEGCPCLGAACGACRSQCESTTTACSSGCWSSFTGCLNGCTQTYCAAFCQEDLRQCLEGCPDAGACGSECDVANGCNAECNPFTPGNDGDGDGVADGLDNCAADSNPDQADLDGDGTGNICDPSDALLASAQVTVKAAKAGAANGRVTLSGRFSTASDVAFDASAGVTVAFVRADGTTILATWPADRCATRGPSVTCASPDRLSTATFRANRSGTWKVKATVGGLAMASPASPAIAVRVRQDNGAIDRIGHLSVCSRPGSTMRCKMP